MLLSPLLQSFLSYLLRQHPNKDDKPNQMSRCSFFPTLNAKTNCGSKRFTSLSAARFYYLIVFACRSCTWSACVVGLISCDGNRYAEQLLQKAVTIKNKIKNSPAHLLNVYFYCADFQLIAFRQRHHPAVSRAVSGHLSFVPLMYGGNRQTTPSLSHVAVTLQANELVSSFPAVNIE